MQFLQTLTLVTLIELKCVTVCWPKWFETLWEQWDVKNVVCLISWALHPLSVSISISHTRQNISLGKASALCKQWPSTISDRFWQADRATYKICLTHLHTFSSGNNTDGSSSQWVYDMYYAAYMDAVYTWVPDRYWNLILPTYWYKLRVHSTTGFRTISNDLALKLVRYDRHPNSD